MKIPKTLYTKMLKLCSINEKAKKIEKEIIDWFESKGFDVDDEGFTDVIMAKISYGEFHKIEDIEEYVKDYLEDRRR